MMTRRLITRLSAGILLILSALALSQTRPSVQALIEVLRSDTALSAKARACQQLGEFGSSEAVPALATLLSHDILGVYARTGLERIPGEEASAALRQALSRVQGGALVGVINSLGALRDEASVPALIGLTREADPEVAKAALLALGRIANPDALPRIREALTAGPESLRPDAAEACLLAAEHQLALEKAAIAESLYDAVRQANVPTSYRVGATRGAIIARQSDRIPFLIQQLRSDDADFRAVALHTIREIPSDDLATALNAELASAPRDLQIQLLSALTDCHNTQSLSVMSGKAQSDDPAIRLAALRALAKVGGPESTPTFLTALKDRRDEEERSIALTTLERLEGTGVDTQILDALSSSHGSEARVDLIRLLGKRKAVAATDALFEQAAGPDSAVSIAAYQALKPLVGLSDLPRLIMLTKACRVPSVRQAAANAVYTACRNSEDPNQACARVMKELTASSEPAAQRTWVRVLALLGYAEALPAIGNLLQETDAEMTQDIVAYLGLWPDPTPIDVLFEVAERDSHANVVRQRALMIILRLAISAADRRQASDETLIAWYRRAKPALRSLQEKRLLISGLGRAKHMESLRLLASYLEDAEVKLEAVHAVVSAAEPLVKGPDYAAVGTILRGISGVEDQGLLDQIADLEREIASTADRLNKGP